MSRHLNEIRHDYIRYANCWEDAEVLLQGLEVKPGDRVLSIGSAGDNSFSLLTGDPDLVIAVDINPVQLQLIELKKAAIGALDYETFLQFMGFRPCNNRWELYQDLKPQLSKDLQHFWNKRRLEIESGIIYCGKLERYFKLFRTYLLPFIHSKKRIDLLFVEKTAAQQKKFYQNFWNTWRWRILFKLFFSKWVMGRWGRDVQFLKEVQVPVSDFILTQAEKHLSSVNCQHNYFLQFILTGRFENQLPHYAQKTHFELIKKRIDRLRIFKGLAEEAFAQHADFNKFNLSNIFEYMDPELFRSVCQNLMDHSKTGTRYAYWNLMVPRRMSAVYPQLQHDQSYSEYLSQNDNGFFYACFNVDQKR